jgi:hypothetical protein
MYSFLLEDINRYEDNDNEFDELDEYMDYDNEHDLRCGVTCFQCYDDEPQEDELPF